MVTNSKDPKTPMVKPTGTQAASPLNPNVVAQAKQVAGSASPLVSAMPAMPVATPVTPVPATPGVTPAMPVVTPAVPVTPAPVTPTVTPAAVDPLATALKGQPQPVIQAEVKSLQGNVVAGVKTLTDLAGVTAPAAIADLQKSLMTNAATLQAVNALVTPTPVTTATPTPATTTPATPALDAVPAGMTPTTPVDLNGLISAVQGNTNGVLQHLSTDLQNQIGLQITNPAAPVNFTRLQEDIKQVNMVAQGGKVTPELVKQQGQMVLQALGIDPNALT